jgi:hypothetical protein
MVFARSDDPLDPDSVSKAFGRLVQTAGVTPITFHGLRHTHISHQLMDGVHIKIVSERAGHANVSITLAVYAAFIPNMQAGAAAAVDAWLRNELAKPAEGGKSVATSDLEERAGDLSIAMMAVPRGVEPPTFGLGNRCSILLSYGTIELNCKGIFVFARRPKFRCYRVCYRASSFCAFRELYSRLKCCVDPRGGVGLHRVADV